MSDDRVLVTEPDRRVGLDAETVRRVRRLRADGRPVAVVTAHPERWRRTSRDLDLEIVDGRDPAEAIRLRRATVSGPIEYDELLDGYARRLVLRLDRILEVEDLVGETVAKQIRRERSEET